MPRGDRARRAFEGQTLNVYNWSNYIAPGLISEFEALTGARVQYDNYSTDAELEARMTVGDIGYDVIFPSDRTIVPLIKKELLAEIDRSLLTRLNNLDALFLNPPYDPGNRFSVPYFWGTMAVGVRQDIVGRTVADFGPLFDKKHAGRITMLDDAENVVAMAMLHLGYPMNSTDEAHLANVRKLLVEQKPLVQAYTSDSYKEKLIKGDAWVALGWSGDLLQAQQENPNIRVFIPESGTMVFTDNIAIPKSAKNPRLAHEFINFLLDADVAARNATFVRGGTPNVAAKSKLSPRLVGDALVYPSKSVLDKCQWLLYRDNAVTKVEEVWREVQQ
ncbi:MAG: spermidine/putrescine ABC transporter substrate-binding protein [Planctomycetota bacterium]